MGMGDCQGSELYTDLFDVLWGSSELYGIYKCMCVVGLVVIGQSGVYYRHSCLRTFVTSSDTTR